MQEIVFQIMFFATALIYGQIILTDIHKNVKTAQRNISSKEIISSLLQATKKLDANHFDEL